MGTRKGCAALKAVPTDVPWGSTTHAIAKQGSPSACAVASQRRRRGKCTQTLHA